MTFVKSAKVHLGGLDLIRFVAAFAVTTFHLGVVSWSARTGINYELPGGPKYPELWFCSIGWVGVETFFVISGFVIAQSAESNSAYTFLRGRIGRLMPTIWMCATLTLGTVLLLGLGNPHSAFSNYARSLIVYPKGPWIDGVYWTLTLEITFYGLVFLLLLIGQFKNIEGFAVILGCTSGAYVIAHSLFGFPEVSAHLLAQHGEYFALGIFLWLITTKGGTPLRYLLVILMVFCGILEINYLVLGALKGYDAIACSIFWMASVFAIGLAAVIPTAGNSFTRTLGLMTYPLYLLHFAVGSAALRICFWTGRYPALAITICMILAICFCIVKTERNLRRLLESLIDRLTNSIYELISVERCEVPGSLRPRRLRFSIVIRIEHPAMADN